MFTRWHCRPQVSHRRHLLQLEPSYLCTPVLTMTCPGNLLWKVEQKSMTAFACSKVTVRGKRHWYKAAEQTAFVALSDDSAWIIRTNGDLYLQTGNLPPSLSPNASRWFCNKPSLDVVLDVVLELVLGVVLCPVLCVVLDVVPDVLCAPHIQVSSCIFTFSILI